MRTTSSSAVLRELTIQSWSAQRGEQLERVPRARTSRGGHCRGPTRPIPAAGRHGAVEASPAPGCSRRSAPGRRRRRRAARIASAGSCSWMRSRHVRVLLGEHGERSGSSVGRTAVAKPATRTVPAGSAVGSRSTRAASTAARMVTACSARRRPAGVSRTRRPSGSIERCPDLAGQYRDLLRHRRGGDVQRPRRPRASSRAGTVRAAARRRRVSTTIIVHDYRTICPAISRGHERIGWRALDS